MPRWTLVAALLLVLGLAPPAHAAAVSVTTAADRDNGSCASGDCSLREALKYAPSGSDIEVPAGTYVLSLGALRIDRPGQRLDVSGPLVEGVAGGAHPTAVIRQEQDGARVVEVVARDSDVTLRNLRITGGRATAASPAWGPTSGVEGGGIGNNGALTLDRVEVDGNRAEGGSAGGGGISNTGALIVQRSAIRDNDAVGTGNANESPNGGGIHITAGSATIQRSAIESNSASGPFAEGGGIAVRFAGLLLEGSRVSGNVAVSPGDGWADGGGIDLETGGLLVRRSAITGNEADATAGDWRARGGGIHASPLVMTLESTTIHGNAARGGETAGNQNASGGGGMAIEGFAPVHAVNLTLTGNTVAGGTLARGGNVGIGFLPDPAESPLFLRGSIIAEGSAPQDGTDSCHGPVRSEGYNVVDDTGPCGLSAATRDRVGVDPQLGPLQTGGALTPARVPGDGSPARNLAPPGGCLDVEDNPLRLDQRYAGRAAICDAGAVDDGTGGASTAPAGAAAVTVSTTADEPDDGACTAGDCTLREALAHAPSGATVNVPGGRYGLTWGELTVDRSALLDVAGAGAADTIIEQPAGAARVLRIGKPASVTLRGVTLRGGVADRGAGIANAGTLHLRDAVIKENRAVGSDSTIAFGAGIDNAGQLYVHTSVIEANRAEAGGGAESAIGGGIYTATAVSVQRSLIARNVAQGSGNGYAVGGGIGMLVSGGVLLEDTGVEDNDAIGGPESGTASGGGVGTVGGFAFPAPPVLARRSLLAGNDARAGAGGKAVGGGLAATLPSAVTLDRMTITGNGVDGKGAEGGGLQVDGNVPVIAAGSVIADNAATGEGASGPQAGFDASEHPPTLVLGHSVVSGEGADPCGAGTVISRGHSLVDAPSGECGVGGGEGDLAGVEPLLGPLADHGGPVRTREPLPGSPLIGAGGAACFDSFGNPFAVDGRGYPVASECDIGAYDTSTESRPDENSGPATGARPDGEVEDPDPDPEPTPTPTPDPTPTPTPGGPGPGGPGPGGPGPGGPGPGGPGPGPEQPAKPKAADVIRLPSANRCVKRGKALRVRVRVPSGDAVRRTTVKVGRKKARRLTGRRARGQLKVGKLPRRGKVKVRVQVELRSGAKLSRTRTYRICR